MNFLQEQEIERLLHQHHDLKSFWETNAPLLIIRSQPTLEDPIYEVQLAWDLGDRLETAGWLWVDALEGKILQKF